MRQPVRYYIEQSDNHAVVRSIAVPPVTQLPRSPAEPVATGVVPETTPVRRARVRRLVRAAIHRSQNHS